MVIYRSCAEDRPSQPLAEGEAEVDVVVGAALDGAVGGVGGTAGVVVAAAARGGDLGVNVSNR
jgi:hypothetical protein